MELELTATVSEFGNADGNWAGFTTASRIEERAAAGEETDGYRSNNVQLFDHSNLNISAAVMFTV